MPRWADDILSLVDARIYARVVAIMACRFKTDNNQRNYNAREILDYLESLPHCFITAFCVDIDHLKLALASKSIRNALGKVFPGRFEFHISCTADDHVADGPHKFRRGCQVQFILNTKESGAGNDLSDIDSLKEKLMTYLNADVPLE